MTRQRICHGVFRSIADLQAEINAYLAENNASREFGRAAGWAKRFSLENPELRPPS